MGIKRVSVPIALRKSPEDEALQRKMRIVLRLSLFISFLTAGLVPSYWAVAGEVASGALKFKLVWHSFVFLSFAATSNFFMFRAEPIHPMVLSALCAVGVVLAQILLAEGIWFMSWLDIDAAMFLGAFSVLLFPVLIAHSVGAWAARTMLCGDAVKSVSSTNVSESPATRTNNTEKNTGVSDPRAMNMGMSALPLSKEAHALQVVKPAIPNADVPQLPDARIISHDDGETSHKRLQLPQKANVINIYRAINNGHNEKESSPGPPPPPGPRPGPPPKPVMGTRNELAIDVVRHELVGRWSPIVPEYDGPPIPPSGATGQRYLQY